MVLGVLPLISLVEVILLLQSNLVRVQQFPLQCPRLTLIYPSHLEEGWGLPVAVQWKGGWHTTLIYVGQPSTVKGFLAENAQHAFINFFLAYPSHNPY